jgi:diguanylate cyclase (GGDEF)-like protein
LDRHAQNKIRRLEAEILRLRRLVYNDDLTGLRNRRYFEERLREELHRADREGQECSLLTVDVDDFKAINDELGHAAGDHVLRDVGMMLSINGRAVDVPCRIGGDEFAIILPHTTLEGAATARARFEAAQKDLRRPDGRPITLSFGGATYPTEERSFVQLIDRADRSMYAAKKQKQKSTQAA